MRTTYAIIVVVIIVLLAGAWYFFSQQAVAPTTATSTPAQTTTTAAPTQTAATPSASAPSTVTTVTTTTTAPTPQHFTVNGNDTTADVMTITVKKGTPVSITFGADATGTYHGGLDFRSSVLNTGTIAPGATKTVSFTADQSFVFQPYWPATNIAKPYHISVVVN